MNKVGERSAIADRELFIDIMQVDLDCSFGDAEALGDFFVRQPFSNEEHGLLFALSQNVVEPCRTLAALLSAI